MTIDIHKVITVNPITKNLMKPWGSNKLLLLLLGVDVYHLGMSLSRPLAAPSTTFLSFAMSLATTRHAAT